MRPAFPGNSTPALFVLAALAACGGTEVVDVPLRIGGLSACPIGEPLGISLSAYGDFDRVAMDDWLVEMASAPRAFPEDTRAVWAFLPGFADGSRPAFAAMAESTRSLPSAFDLVLLPEDARPCALTFPADGPPAAPTIAARNDGGFVLAGGVVEMLGDARAFVWSPATRRFTPLEGLASRRMLAGAATTPDGTVVVTGGAAGVDSGANATAVILLSDGTAFERDPIALGEPRCDHAAVGLADGSVLLLGGRASPGSPPVRTAEIIDVAARRTRADFAPMILPRAGHEAAVLDDGSVVLAGGLDAAGSAVMLVERFDPSSRTFIAEESFAPEDGCELGWSIVPLIGGRALLVSRCEARARYVLLRVGGLTRLERDSGVFDGVVEAAAARTDGRVLQVGRARDPEDPAGPFQPWAELIDGASWRAPRGLDVEEPITRDPDETIRLLPLASGDLVEVAWLSDQTRNGSSVRLRTGAAQSSFQNPPSNLLLHDAQDFALDAAFTAEFGARWSYEDSVSLGIVPFERGGEAWLIRAKFLRFGLEVSHQVNEGDPLDASAVLVSRLPAPLSRTGAPLRVEWTDARLAIRAEPECAVEAPISPGTDHRVVRVERTADDRIRASITDVDAGGTELATWSVGPCVVADLAERVAIGLAPALGHRLSTFTIHR